MPYVRKRRYPSFRRRGFGVKRRRIGQRYRRTVNRGFRKGRRLRVWKSPFNNGALYKFKFFDTYNETFNTYNARAFRLNSLYDPDYTGIGGSPSGVDTVARMYLRYEVLAAKVVCHFYPNQNVSYTQVGLIAVDQSYAAVTCYDYNSCDSQLHELARNVTRTACLTPANSTMASDKWLKLYVPIRRVVGRRDDDCTAAFGNNPVVGALCCVVAYDRAGVNTSMSVSYDIKITYYARCYTMNPVNWTN